MEKNNKMRRKRLKRLKRLSLILMFALALILGLFFIWQGETIFRKIFGASVKNKQNIQEELSAQNSGSKSPISGQSCQNANRRPMAVMLSGDTETRPLSGIGQADMVFEMQVVQGSITRFMAVYVCESPASIGSVRSSRDDFIPLALGLDAIYAHWGGSSFALDELKTGIADNIDALPNPFNAFYRKSGLEAPHNGFTSMTRLFRAAEKLNYRIESEFSGYKHLLPAETKNHGNEKKILRIGYPGDFRVGYEYSPEKNSYFRYRGGIGEIDNNTDKQVEVKNVVIMRAQSEWLADQYNDVQVEGEGQAEYYINGQVSQGLWKKDKKDPKSKLFFYDQSGQEIEFVPGLIWVEITDPMIKVTWQ